MRVARGRRTARGAADQRRIALICCGVAGLRECYRVLDFERLVEKLEARNIEEVRGGVLRTDRAEGRGGSEMGCGKWKVVRLSRPYGVGQR